MSALVSALLSFNGFSGLRNFERRLIQGRARGNEFARQPLGLIISTPLM
jgi:hypothetical protein